VQRAQQLRGLLLSRFGQLREFIEGAKETARRHGFVQTLGGRRRPLPAISSSSNEERARAERQCVNSIVQGTAADVVKAAMLACADALRAGGLDGRCRLVAQVHDELLFELDDAADAPRVAAAVGGAMEGVCAADSAAEWLRLGVRLPVKLAAGPSWGRLQPLPAAPCDAAS
jgi:DNA polymerase-1